MIHRELSGEQVHVPHAWEYADSAARLAATGFDSNDRYKFALQLDTSALYVLSSISPIVWVPVGAGMSKAQALELLDGEYDEAGTADAAVDAHVLAQGHVAGGNYHDHSDGDGGQISYTALGDLPTLGTAAPLDAPATGNASTTQVVKGNDTRLSDARTPTAHTHADADHGGQLAHSALSGAGAKTHAQIDAGLESAASENLILNPEFTIEPYDYASGTATTSANQFIFGRWFVVVSGESATWSTLGKGKLLTVPAGGLSQCVVGANVQGGVYTLAWEGTATATVNGTSVANGGQVTLPAAANAVIKFSSGTLGKVQLVYGSFVPIFKPRQDAIEKILCRYYYQRVYFSGIAESASQICINHSYVMRTTPTAAFIGNMRRTATGVQTTPSSTIIAIGNGTVSHIYSASWSVALVSGAMYDTFTGGGYLSLNAELTS
jgi:hypothetical protein